MFNNSHSLLHKCTASLASSLRRHRIPAWQALAGPSGDHLVQPPAQAGSPRAGCTAPRPGGAGISPEKEYISRARAPLTPLPAAHSYLTTVDKASINETVQAPLLNPVPHGRKESFENRPARHISANHPLEGGTFNTKQWQTQLRFVTLCEDVAGKKKPEPSAPPLRPYSSNAVSVLLKQEIRKRSLLPGGSRDTKERSLSNPGADSSSRDSK